ncbi:tripartite tricarboxylate transporter TctB family protein [Pseudohoeflea coraliihabitans]|uniref:Tripartite tricarboxylate transporter TctB family protein n=1 Tax=Pseudohoeflea coraliihabitans TaxID=2860393 RepID=A0ABS6WML2_9HYPH|nr:tripartite tricarboxylate transporter TctB family protein [Pseudohoeflea sp. DP4N28-3]MBW3097193.1 tripartite tricarboxylate transporter TctB family protein [Pseudohoeflea sp. DP4N28-3]
MMSSSRLHKDAALGGFGVLIGAGLALEANRLGYPSKVFPLLVSITILLLSALIGLRAILQSRRFERPQERFLPTFRTFYVAFVAIIYVLLVEVIGFYPSSFLCVIIISILTDKKNISRNVLLKTACAAVVFLAAIYLIFSYGFGSTISDGMLF